MPDLDFTLIISRDNAPCLEVTLGHESVRALAEAADDDITQLELLSLLAEHPSAGVRAIAAGRDHLSDAAVARLMADRDPEVRRALFTSAAFRRLVGADALLAIVEDDAELAVAAAYEPDVFLEVDPALLTKALTGHADPGVRAALARGGTMSRTVLRALADDADADVRAAAHARLDRG